MDKCEWVARCTARYTKHSSMTTWQAYESALVCYNENADGESPEYMADEDMAAWTDDFTHNRNSMQSWSKYE